eukprot:scaffold2745_cov262-Alexandrium_tamarense.AAC.6
MATREEATTLLTIACFRRTAQSDGSTLALVSISSCLVVVALTKEFLLEHAKQKIQSDLPKSSGSKTTTTESPSQR